jgi:hypothetical protein
VPQASIKVVMLSIPQVANVRILTTFLLIFIISLSPLDSNLNGNPLKSRTSCAILPSLSSRQPSGGNPWAGHQNNGATGLFFLVGNGNEMSSSSSRQLLLVMTTGYESRPNLIAGLILSKGYNTSKNKLYVFFADKKRRNNR